MTEPEAIDSLESRVVTLEKRAQVHKHNIVELQAENLALRSRVKEIESSMNAAKARSEAILAAARSGNPLEIFEALRDL